MASLTDFYLSLSRAVNRPYVKNNVTMVFKQFYQRYMLPKFHNNNLDNFKSASVFVTEYKMVTEKMYIVHLRRMFVTNMYLKCI